MISFRRSLAPALIVLASIVFGFASDAACQEKAAEPDAVFQAFSAGRAGPVREIAAPGVPGSLSVFGPRSSALVTGGKQANDVVVACATWGSGRVVALAHDGYLLNVETLAVADTGRFFLNALDWASRADKRELCVGVWNNDRLAKWLAGENITAIPLAGSAWWQGLDDVDVLVTHTRAFATPQARAAAQAFITAGGGLIAADCGWGWAQLNPGRSLVSDHPGNLLLYPAGLLWTAGYAHRNSPQGFQLEASPSSYLNASVALEALTQQERDQTGLRRKHQADGVHSIKQALSVLPADDTVLIGRLRALRATAGRSAVPSPQTPVRAEDGLSGVFVALDVHEMKTKPAPEIAAHPAANVFPGEVPSSAKAVDVKRIIDTRIPGWHSTGVYAVAGKPVVVTLPPQAVDRGLQLRIGCHSDILWGHKEWKRMPDVCRTWPLQAATTEGANGMGGLVYIEVPSGCRLEQIEVGIAGAVAAPRFVLGETQHDEWIADIRQRPGPWAELATKKIILTVPSRVVRELDDPDELLRVWDQVLDACADLARIPRDRARPERFVLDQQISAGYMHSGYPIMAHLDVEKTLVDAAMIAKGESTWGFFHEIGHNHQAPAWTFDGAVEVTVNLFTMYVHDRVCGRDDMGTRQNGPNLLLAADRDRKIKPYFERGASFQEWKEDPFLALCMYIQLQQAFGWEAFQDVFEEYGKLAQAELPKNDDEKRDQWLVRFSRRVGKDLGPFFQAWGVPTSDAARRQVADLPKWLPESFPPQ